jgi:uncharacterized protein YicC (UPF0701 family)
MTGYASAQHTPGSQPATTKAASLQHPRAAWGWRSARSTAASSTCPSAWARSCAHEPALRELITAKIKRGKVEVRAGVEGTAADTVREPSVRTLQRLSAVQDTVRSWMPEAGALSVAEILRLAGAESAGDRLGRARGGAGQESGRRPAGRPASAKAPAWPPCWKAT